MVTATSGQRLTPEEIKALLALRGDPFFSEVSIPDVGPYGTESNRGRPIPQEQMGSTFSPGAMATPIATPGYIPVTNPVAPQPVVQPSAASAPTVAQEGPPQVYVGASMISNDSHNVPVFGLPYGGNLPSS